MAKKKPRRIKHRGPAWTRLAIEMAVSYAPPVITCAHCGYPVLKGYCCTFCDTDNPEGH